MESKDRAAQELNKMTECVRTANLIWEKVGNNNSCNSDSAAVALIAIELYRNSCVGGVKP